MQVERLDINGVKVAVISRDEMLIRDAQSALELAMSVKHQTGADRFVIPKRAVCEDFFILSTGLAGEVLQKLRALDVNTLTPIESMNVLFELCSMLK